MGLGKVNQDRISRLERGTDLLLSTLRRCVTAMGGTSPLSLNFPIGTPEFLLDLPPLTPNRRLLTAGRPDALAELNAIDCPCAGAQGKGLGTKSLGRIRFA